MIFPQASATIGTTPLVSLARLSDAAGGEVCAKLEYFNPGGSVKDRIGATMIGAAEAKGLLVHNESTLVEPTSGNTGIALAFVGASRGYKVTLVMPETMSVERRKVLKAFGANVVLSPGSARMPGAIALAEEMMAREPDRYFMPQQFTNPANPAVHEQTTGPEIWNDTDGAVDVLIAGVGTGGTLTGIARYIKRTRGKKIIAVAVEPHDSPVITQALAGQEIKPGGHLIQGIGAGFIPAVLDLALVDRVETVSNEEAMEYARRLAREEGILSGISCGAAAAVAARLARQHDLADKTIVTILPDSGERYLSTPLFES